MSGPRGREVDWGAWLLPGVGLVVAAAAVLFTLWPRTEQGAAVASPTASAGVEDEHQVTTDEGVVSFTLENASIVVRVATPAATTELGRATLPFWASAPPDGTPIPTGSALFIMVCGQPDAPDVRRYVFGHLDTAETVQYAGPDAVGHGTSDDLFLFALQPGVEPGPIRIRTSDGAGVGVPADAFDSATSDGARQPSGCFVSG